MLKNPGFCAMGNCCKKCTSSATGSILERVVQVFWLLGQVPGQNIIFAASRKCSGPVFYGFRRVVTVPAGIVTVPRIFAELREKTLKSALTLQEKKEAVRVNWTEAPDGTRRIERKVKA